MHLYGFNAAGARESIFAVIKRRNLVRFPVVYIVCFETTRKGSLKVAVTRVAVNPPCE